MTTYSFGTGVNPAHYVEIPSGSTNPPPRPAAMGTLKVRSDADLTPLPDATYSAITGYFSFTTEDVPVVQVSADGGSTWVPLIGIEAEKAAAAAGVIAGQANATALQAIVIANAALAAANSGGETFIHATGQVGPAKIFTLAQIHARDDQDLIDTTDITGLATVATSGLSRDLTDANQPNGSVLLDDNGFVPDAFLQAGGGGGGAGQKFIFQNTDGTWPARTTVSTDPTECVEYIPAYDPTKRPAIGTDAATAYVMNASLSRPGDKLRNLQPAA
jgi:hypothetical protein